MQVAFHFSLAVDGDRWVSAEKLTNIFRAYITTVQS